MSTITEDPPEHTAASLATGILSDLQRLVEQQFRLTRREIEDECRQWSTVAAVFGLGVGSLFLAGMMICLTLAYLLHWTVSPAGTDPGQLACVDRRGDRPGEGHRLYRW